MEQILRQHAALTPHSEAVIDGPNSLTYQDLLSKASDLAQLLGLKEVVRPAEPIGILLGVGFQQVVAQVAVRLAGGTCVPIEPSQPSKRICSLLHDINVKRVITDKTEPYLFGGFEHFSMRDVGWRAHPSCQPNDGINGRDPTRRENERSHILFTSGSTGQPKPVQITEGGIIHLANSTPVTPLLKSDRVAAFNNPGFDLSLFEIWVPLLCGSTIVVVPKDIVTDPGRLPTFLAATQVSVSIVPTALFNIVASVSPRVFQGLRHVITAGEAANARVMQAVLEDNPPNHLWNAYGPTEGTTMVTMFEVTLQDALTQRISIGRPVGKSEIFLLDGDLNIIQEPGISGEICIVGPGKSPGYVNRERDNKERFIEMKHPKNGRDSVVQIYRTGDLGQWRADKSGNLEFLGRRDSQVKHHGYRVELEEIERIAQSHNQVTACVAFQRRPLSALGTAILVASIIPQNHNPGLQEDVTRFMQERLPSYMIPDKIELASSYPLTPNGKLDRNALAQQHLPGHSERRDANQSTGKGDRGALVAEMWKQMLQIDHVDDQDDFFLLGGSSLQSAALIGLIKERTGHLITMDELHDHSRLADLRHFLEEAPGTYAPQRTTAPDNTGIWKGDVDIVDELKLVPDWEAPDEGRVFLTGVTGFVGVHLLHHLLHRPGVKQVACLARRKGALSAATRVQHAMEQYEIFPESLEISQKMVIFEGDMADEHLGLGAERFEWLTNWASVVFHLGAKVNFCESYQEHYHDNVLGTRNVLKVAVLGRRKGFHYMSSIDVWGPTGGVLGTQHVAEDGSLQPHLQALRYDLGYGQSQWTAEAMVRRMQSKGLPVAIYRPGFVIGDSTTGASNPNDFITRLIVGCIQMRTFPRIQEMRFEYCTVDFVVTATLHIASNNQNLGHAYHLVSPDQTRSITVDETCALINDAGYPVTTIDYWEWVEQAVQSQRPDGPLAPVLPVLQERVMGQLSRWEAGQYSPRYDCTNSGRALADCPQGQYIPFTCEILRRYIGFWNRKGYYKI